MALTIEQKMQLINEVDQELNQLTQQQLSLEEIKAHYERLLDKMTDAHFWNGATSWQMKRRSNVRNRLSIFGEPAQHLMGYHLRNTVTVVAKI